MTRICYGQVQPVMIIYTFGRLDLQAIDRQLKYIRALTCNFYVPSKRQVNIDNVLFSFEFRANHEIKSFTF